MFCLILNKDTVSNDRDVIVHNTGFQSCLMKSHVMISDMTLFE